MSEALSRPTKVIVIGALPEVSDALRRTLNEATDVELAAGLFGKFSDDEANAILDADADVAIIGNGPRFDRLAPSLRHLMLRKIPVISDSGDMVWPWLKYPHLADAISNEARRAGVAIVGIGNDPAAVRAAVPMLRRTQSVRNVVLRRQVDAPGRRYGRDKTVEEFRKLASQGLIGLPGTGEMAVLFAQALGRHPMRAEVRTTFKPTLDDQKRVIGLHQVSSWAGDGIEVTVEYVVHPDTSRDVDATDSVEIIGDQTELIPLSNNNLAGDFLAAVRTVRTLKAGLHTPLDRIDE